MKVESTTFNDSLTQDEVDSIINALAVSYDKFAVISGLFGRAYGVQVMCDRNDNLFNECARHKVMEHLAKAHNRAQYDLGYDITPQYHYEEIDYKTSEHLKLKRPGFAGFVQLTITAAAMGAQNVDPYLITDVPLVDSGSGYTIAQLDATIVDNPNSIVLVDATTGGRYNPQMVTGFPKRNGGNWEIALDNTLLPTEIGSKTVNAYHCKLIKVDIPAEALTAGQTLHPVYPGTNQIIPYAKAPEDLNPGTRLWFHSYVLVDEAFAIEGADFRGGNYGPDFYKLLPTIEMKIFEDTAKLPELSYRQAPDCTDVALAENTNETPVFTDVTVEGYNILSDIHSIIEMFPDHSQALLDNVGNPVRYKVWYKTDPSVLGYEGDYQAIQDAIAHLTAAELPLKVCNCVLDKDGFIQISQQSYSQVRISITNERVENLEHGNLYGQKVYETRIAEVNQYKRVVRT